MPQFKHASLIAMATDCPPPGAVGATREAYRFVFNPVDDRSFKTPAEKFPPRFERDRLCCDCGLSMFETEDKARAFFAAQTAKRPTFPRQHGDHLGRFPLVPAHGVQTEIEDGGHFDLHEYASTNLAHIAIVVGPL